MRYPGAEWRPISINYQPGGCVPRYLILHVMQGTLAGTDSWFRNPAAQVSAHFGIGKEGAVYQWCDTADTAWHAAQANPVAIGVEHEGDSGDSLTDAQLAADAELLAWATEHHPIPLQITNDPVHGSGLAWHGLGGTAWGGHFDCPGSPIVAQRPAIIARAQAIRTPSPAPAPVMLPPALPEDPMLLNKGTGAVTPVAIPDTAKSLRFLAAGTAELEVTFHGSPPQALVLSWAGGSHSLIPPARVYAALVTRTDAGGGDVCVVAQ
jgi:hypothetical protein